MSEGYRLDGKLMKRRREELALDQTKLAEAVGIARTPLNKIERGGQKASYATTQHIASALGAHVDDLILEEGLAPSLPPWKLVGREADTIAVKQLLPPDGSGDGPGITVLLGPAGVGKSTLSATLANDTEINNTFDDGVLFASLGNEPDAYGCLSVWARAYGVGDVSAYPDVATIKARLTAAFRRKRILYIVDDVWQAQHFAPLLVAGKQSAILVATRSPAVANTLTTPNQIYEVPCLDAKSSAELFESFAPGLFHQYPEVRQFVSKLGGLPLALHVAGKLLHSQAARHVDIPTLVEELQSGVQLMDTAAPLDLLDVTPTVAATISRSVELLDPDHREQFASLGAFATEGTFDVAAYGEVCNSAAPREDLHEMVDLGLVGVREKLVPERQAAEQELRYQLHGVIGMYAQTLLDKDFDSRTARLRHATY